MGIFTDDEVWTGGFYELALEYATGADVGLVDGLRELWRLGFLDGCYLDRELDPKDQPRLEFDASLLSHGHLQGVATLPGGKRVACGTCCIQDDDGSDWLVFYCPMSAIGHTYPVGGFPFDNENHESWRVEVEDWLADVGQRVFRQAPFHVGLVGFETSGDFRAADLVENGIPETRRMGVLVPNRNSLDWHARTVTG